MRSVALALILALGCAEPVATTPVEGTFEDPVATDLGTEPFRPRHRMSIEQLDRSIRAVTGGIGWTPSPRSSSNLFEQYADTLGVPDYLQNTVEDRETSLVFAKLLDDAARSVCARLMEREALGEEERTFLVEAGPDATIESAPAAIDANLAYLLLRFHGRHVPPDSPLLARWRRLFERTSVDPSTSAPAPMRGWNAVCVALLNHPDFYTY